MTLGFLFVNPVESLGLDLAVDEGANSTCPERISSGK